MENPDAYPRSGGRAAFFLFLICAVTWVAAANTGATQYIAYRLNYHPALGEPLFGKIYAPHLWLSWFTSYYGSAGGAFREALAGAIVSAFVWMTAFYLLLGLFVRRLRRHEGVHGTAHWADESEIRECGLFPPEGGKGAGVYVGGVYDKQGNIRYLRHNGPEHIAAFAPTRSGKGVGLVVPTLLSWPHSCIVNDQKGELWNIGFVPTKVPKVP